MILIIIIIYHSACTFLFLRIKSMDCSKFTPWNRVVGREKNFLSSDWSIKLTLQQGVNFRT